MDIDNYETEESGIKVIVNREPVNGCYRFDAWVDGIQKVFSHDDTCPLWFPVPTKLSGDTLAGRALWIVMFDVVCREREGKTYEEWKQEYADWLVSLASSFPS